MSAGYAIASPTATGGLHPLDRLTPKLTDPYSIANPLSAAITFCLTLASLSTAIRLYTKFCIIKKPGWEDYAMFVGWGGFVSYCGVEYSVLKHGAGVHQWDVPVTKLVHFAQGAYACEILFPASIAFIKLSICLQSLRIFVAFSGRRFWCIQTVIWVNTTFYVVSFFVSIFHCAPISKLWDPPKPGSCINYKVYILVTAGFNLVSDLLMLIFTLVCIWKLKMPTRRKQGLSAIFLIGSLALVASTIRIIFGYFYLEKDETFVLSQIAVCSTGELAAGIIAGNGVSPRFFSTCSTNLAGVLRKRSQLSAGLDEAV